MVAHKTFSFNTWTHQAYFLRYLVYRWLITRNYSINAAEVLKTLMSIRVTWKACESRFLGPGFLISRSGVGPEDLYVSQVPR